MKLTRISLLVAVLATADCGRSAGRSRPHGNPSGICGYLCKGGYADIAIELPERPQEGKSTAPEPGRLSGTWSCQDVAESRRHCVISPGKKTI